MSRTVKDATLATRASRLKLAPGRRHWRSLGGKLHLGYRRSEGEGKAGRWLLRIYSGRQKYEVEVLRAATGDKVVADDIADANGVTVLDYPEAQKRAHAVHAERARIGAELPVKAGAFTVADAMHAYLDGLDRAGRKSAKDARGRTESMILPVLGHIPCDRLAKGDIERWLDGLAKAPPRTRGKNGGVAFRKVDLDDAEVRRRRRSNANRVLNVLRAGLTRAWRDGKIQNNTAWATVEPFRQADAARIRFLEIAELQRLVSAADADFRNLLKGAIYTGARYSELTALEARDFKADVGKVHIRIAKAGKGRYVTLTDEGAAFFLGLTAGKLGEEPIFVRADGERWRRGWQSIPMRETCKHARITPPAGFHLLRHAFAAHAVQNGASLQVVAKALGHASSRLTEQWYAHLQPSYEDEQIRAAALSLGLAPDRKVASIRPRRRPA
jgi:integrase